MCAALENTSHVCIHMEQGTFNDTKKQHAHSVGERREQPTP